MTTPAGSPNPGAPRAAHLPWPELLAPDPQEQRWLTMPVRCRVLVVAGTVTSTMRLLALLPVIDNDPRVQVVFTHDPDSPSALRAGVPELLATVQAMVIPWPDATRLRFDLILTANERDRVDQLDGPAVLFPHGAGFQKRHVTHHGVAGLGTEHLLHDGRPVHTAITLAHSEQRAFLPISHPELVDRAVAVGDPCVDVLLAHRHRRPRYRDVLGVGDRHLVVLTSTWGPASLLGHTPDLPEQLLHRLPYDEYRICLLTHPGIVAAHGQRQLRTWLAAAERAGLMTIPLEQRWEPILISADCVIADQGSMSLYAAALDLPLLLAGGHPATTLPDSPLAELAARAPRLALDHPGEHIDKLIKTHTPGRYADISARTVDAPGTASRRIRRLLYQLTDLDEPAVPASLGSLPAPVVSQPAATAFTVTADDRTVVRTPATALPQGWRPEQHEHLVAHALDAPGDLVEHADILYTDTHTQSGYAQHPPTTELFHHWPRAALVATVLDERTCRVVTRQATAYDLTLSRPDRDQPSVDPLLLASVALLHQRRSQPLAGHHTVILRGHAVPISIDSAQPQDATVVPPD